MLNMRIKEKEGTTKELRKELCIANETYNELSEHLEINDVKQRVDNEFSEKLENKTSQPVTGKCYHCTRTIESIKSWRGVEEELKHAREKGEIIRNRKKRWTQT